MIYDEGFEVTVGGKKFFAFNHYERRTPGQPLTSTKAQHYLQDCSKTLVGWFHDNKPRDTNHWGCW